MSAKIYRAPAPSPEQQKRVRRVVIKMNAMAANARAKREKGYRGPHRYRAFA